MLLTRRPPLWLGIVAAAAGVTLTTLVVFALRAVAPVVSLGVVYLVAVLVIASTWGVWLGLATALASALAFNFFHIPPTGRFTITGVENWVALVVFFLAAALTSSLTEVARRRATEAEQRRQEADLAAEMARLLLRGGRLEETLPAVSERLARAFALPSASITATAVRAPSRCARGHDRSGRSASTGLRTPCAGSRCGSSRRWRRCWPPRWSATR